MITCSAKKKSILGHLFNSKYFNFIVLRFIVISLIDFPNNEFISFNLDNRRVKNSFQMSLSDKRSNIKGIVERNFFKWTIEFGCLPFRFIRFLSDKMKYGNNLF